MVASLYVHDGGGVVQVVDTAARLLTATIPLGGSGETSPSPRTAPARTWRPVSSMSSTPPPTRSSSRSPPKRRPSPASAPTPPPSSISPDGTRAYVAVFFLELDRSGSPRAAASCSWTRPRSRSPDEVFIGSVPGSLALTPDGSRLYVGIQSTFVNTGYGSGFLPGHARRRWSTRSRIHGRRTIHHRLRRSRDAAEHPRRYRRDAGPACRLRRRSQHDRRRRGRREHERGERRSFR